MSQQNTNQWLGILQGGLQAYLDGTTRDPTVQQDNRAEATPPTARPTDRDTALPPAQPVSVFDHMTAKEYAIGIGGILLVGGFFFLLAKAVK